MKTSTMGKEPMDAKYKRYWAIGIIIAILVAALLSWNSGIFVKSSTAATVGDQKYTVAEFGYFYHTVANNTINMARQYAQYGITSGYDADKSPSEQIYDQSSGKTYEDYFKETALDNLQKVTVLCAQAKADQYTLSEAGEQEIEQNMAALTTYSAQSGYEESAYLKLLYGKYMTKSLFKELLHDSILANEYSQQKMDQFTYTDDQLNTYYTDNAASLDTYEYRYCYINYQTEDKTDADGNAIDPTDEEIAAAMQVAAGNADAMVAKVKAGTAFNTAAAEYVSSDSAASYADPEYNHKTDTLGSSLDSNFSEWMESGDRKSGDITSIEVDKTGYCVVQFLGRTKGDDLYQTMNYRNISVLAETTQGDDGTALPTADQLAAAKTKAEDLLAQWKSGGATADFFGTLASENSADDATKSNGGLNQDANRDDLSSSITDWLFAKGRQVGETAIVENKDANGNTLGYQILYVDGFGEIHWKYQATSKLRSDDYDKWYAALQEQYPTAMTDAAKHVTDA